MNEINAITTNNKIQSFNGEFGEVRTLLINDEVWFVGKDVATALGYKDSINALKKHVDEEDKMGCQNATPYIIDKFGRKQHPVFINESGVYALIFGSKLESAKKFKHWVTSEVLPSIRKTGEYSIKQNLPTTYIEALEQLLESEKQKLALEQKNETLFQTTKVQEQLINELQPKANYTSMVLKCEGLVSITQIAKDYGMSARELNKILHDLKIQYKLGNQWLLYAKYQAYGYTKSQTITYVGKDGKKYANLNTKWTQAGRLFLYNELKKNGILPLMEIE